jgi:diacylglycerol kinase (ATP)
LFGCHGIPTVLFLARLDGIEFLDSSINLAPIQFMHKTKVLFIVNPISGKGKGKQIVNMLEKKIDKSKIDYEVVYTEKSKHATELSKNAVERGFDIVTAIGGDGSMHETALGLIGSNTALAIIPTGSGNGLARHLNIPMNVNKAIETINKGNKIVIDTLQIGKRLGVGIAGIGFDGYVSELFSKFGKRGLITYAKIIIKEYSGYKPKSITLLIDNKEYTFNPLLISFANSSQFGNNATIAPMANVQDNILDVCVLNKLSIFQSIAFAVKLFNKKTASSKFLQIIPCNSLKVLNNDCKFMHIDGEPKKAEQVFDISINPLSLNVIVP